MRTFPRAHRSIAIVGALALAIFPAACDGGATEDAGARDAGPDATALDGGMRDDAGADAGIDASVDGGIDAGMDAGPLSTFDRALAFLGGRGEVSALHGFRVTSSGARSTRYEGLTPSSPERAVSSFTAVTAVDVDADDRRIDYVRMIGGTSLTYREIFTGVVGAIEGSDDVFGAGTRAMSSARWASGRWEMELLHPVLLLREVLDGARSSTDAGTDTIAGEPFEILEISDPVHPIRMWVGATDGRIARVSTLTNDELVRDVEARVELSDWMMADGFSFPGGRRLFLDGALIHDETLSAAEFDPVFGATEFALPAGVTPVFDARTAGFGSRSPELFQGMVARGMPFDGAGDTVSGTQLSPDVFVVGGGGFNSLLVEQSNGLVLVDAPLSTRRSMALIAWTRAMFPAKPITHVISTHHHAEHAAGLRELVAEGAIIVVHEATVPFLTDEVFSAPSTVAPDTLASAPQSPTFDAIPNGGERMIDDSRSPVLVRSIVSSHASDMLVVHVPSASLLFQSDLFVSMLGGPLSDPGLTRELVDSVTDLSISTSCHGRSTTGTTCNTWIEVVSFATP